jgi:hypothetical protein
MALATRVRRPNTAAVRNREMPATPSSRPPSTIATAPAASARPTMAGPSSRTDSDNRGRYRPPAWKSTRTTSRRASALGPNAEEVRATAAANAATSAETMMDVASARRKDVRRGVRRVPGEASGRSETVFLASLNLRACVGVSLLGSAVIAGAAGT